MFNIFTIAFGAIVFGLVLATLITRKSPKHIQMVPTEEDFDKDPKNARVLQLEDLYRLGEKMCAENGLVIKEKMTVSPKEVHWIAETQNAFFFGNYVLGFYVTDSPDEFVSLPTILEFKDFIKSAGSTKGLFFTNSYFTRDVLQPLEGPKVNLYNRKKIVEEIQKSGLTL